jgi:hypothetical protein
VTGAAKPADGGKGCGGVFMAQERMLMGPVSPEYTGEVI